jgi:hypothetical protein
MVTHYLQGFPASQQLYKPEFHSTLHHRIHDAAGVRSVHLQIPWRQRNMIGVRPSVEIQV